MAKPFIERELQLVAYSHNDNKIQKQSSTAFIASNMTSFNPGQYNPYNPNQSGRNLPFQNNPNTFVPIDYRMSVHDDVRLSFRSDINHPIFKEHEGHIPELVATVILVLGIVIPICIRIAFPEDFSLAVAISIAITAYLLYLCIGCLSSDLVKYLDNCQQGHTFEEEYNRIRGMNGQFDFKAECYHKQMRNRPNSVIPDFRDVVTHLASQTIVPAYTADISGNIDRISSETSIVFINFIINYKFSNDYSRNKIDELFYNFKRVNTRDDYQDIKMSYNIPNLELKRAFYVGDLGCDYSCWFGLFTMFGLVWPYSLWVESKISRFDVTYTKVVTM